MYINLANQRCFVASPLQSPDDSNVAVLFLHGAGMDHTIWQPVLSLIVPRKCSVLVPDLPGHGQTCGEAFTSISSMAVWVHDLLEELQIKHVIIVGHSMGSLIAIEMAHRWPDLVRAVVLAGSSLKMSVNSDLLKQAASKDPKAKDLIAQWGVGYKTKDPEIMAQIKATQDLVRKILESNPAESLYCDLTACHNYDQAPQIAPKLKTKTLVIAGRADRLTPSAASEELFNALEHKTRQFCIIEDCGHMMMVENPNQFVDNLEAFLEKCLR